MPIFSKPDNIQVVTPVRKSGLAELFEVSASLRRTDILVFILILGFGILQFFSAERHAGFLNDDVFFADAGRSLVEHGFYGINGYAETNQPPGLSVILGLLCKIGFCGHVASLRVMAIFGTLGFLVSYELLRRQVPRLVAAAICLLLISSRIPFWLGTEAITPGNPYFFFSISALLVASNLENSTKLASRILWGALLMALIASSMMFASAAIAFLGAMVASIFALFLRDRRLAVERLKLYFGVFVICVAVQGLWMSQQKLGVASSGISALEWPLGGFPQSYLAQLKVKNGNNPELGMATPRDIPVRIVKNAYEHSNLLSQMLLRRPIYVAWMSIATIGVLLLIMLGWGRSVWPKGGGFQEWYFVGYEFVYLLWPWDLEPRFFLPVAPLACLYLWRGGETLVLLAKTKPRLLGAVWLPMAIILAVSSWFWVHGSGIASNLPNAGLQDETSFVVWFLSGLLALWMIWADKNWTDSAALLRRYWPAGALRISPVRALQFFSIALVIGLIAIGTKMQIEIGRVNLDPNSASNRLTPDVEAADWISSHTDPKAIVMARYVPTASHYSQRKVIWFPPSSNPQLLMDGILKHKVDFIVVVRRENNYYLPPDDDSFASLLAEHPNAFRLIYQAPKIRIFQVSRSDAPHLG
jgi:hypothetical protein